jgi:uncharacterized RDD family membrane protein YckC
MEPTAAPERVGFWPRLGAYLIDLLVIWAAAALLSRSISALFPRALATMMAERQAMLVTSGKPIPAAALSVADTMMRVAISAVVVSAVYWLTEGIFGRALGKLILGLRIGGDDGRAATGGRLVARMAIKNAGSLLGVLGFGTGAAVLSKGSQLAAWVVLAGCLLVFWPRRQALHDLAAHTAVFHNSDVGPAAP